MSAAARAVTPVTVPRIIFSTESGQTLMPSLDAMSRDRPLANTRDLIRYGMRQTSIAALLLALSEKGVVAILIQELPDDEKLVAALRARLPDRRGLPGIPETRKISASGWRRLGGPFPGALMVSMMENASPLAAGAMRT
jgi:hypothetical protein